MKTSNYIIIAFFTFLFGGVFIFFVAAKLHAKDNNVGPWGNKEHKLEPFSVIVAGPGAYLSINTAEYPRILSAYQTSDTCKFAPFGIRNDTLFVFANPILENHQNGDIVYQDIVYCKDIKSIVAKEKTELIFQDFKIADYDSLIVKLNNAKLNMLAPSIKDSNGSYIFEAKESQILINHANLKMMDVKMDHSKIYALGNSIGNLSGTLKNNSEIQLTNVAKINVAVDPTSRLNIYKN